MIIPVSSCNDTNNDDNSNDSKEIIILMDWICM